MDKLLQANKRIAELTAKLELLEAENVRLKEAQQRIAEVNNNYFILQYLTNNIQVCQTSQKIWETHLHNLGKDGFNYDNAALLLPDGNTDFTVQVTLEDGCLSQAVVRTGDDYVNQAIMLKTSFIAPDNARAAVPLVLKSGEIAAVLLVEKAGGIFCEDLQLLDVYVQQTAAIIENIMLNEKLMQFQELLGRQLDQFVLLHYITKSIHDTANYYDVLVNYLRALCSSVGFGFQAGVLYILTEKEIQTARLNNGKLVLADQAADANPLIGNVLETKQYWLSTDRRHLLMPLNSFGNITAIIEIIHDKPITLEEIQILEIFAMQTSSTIDNTRLKLHLEYLSFHDQLTGLYNRAYFEKQIQRLERGDIQPVGIIICDLDGLKMVNDTCGHTMGDQCIMAAANIIKTVLPPGAVAARMGGDEFAVIMTDKIDAAQVGTCLKNALHNYNAGSPSVPVGLSVGWATGTGEAKVTEILKQADCHMYQDKNLYGEARRDYIRQLISQRPDMRLQSK